MYICIYKCANMEILLEQSDRLLQHIRLDFKRYLHNDIDWKERLIGIKGARGVGKTTLLLQHLKQLALPAYKAAYFAMDDLYFSVHSLKETADTFYKQGGRLLVLDEVHKYQGWSGETKNLYDLLSYKTVYGNKLNGTFNDLNGKTNNINDLETDFQNL